MRAVTALTSITSVGDAVAATQGAQRLGEPRGTQGGASNLVGVLNARAGRVQARDQQLGVSGDRRQQIVEVVRDVTGQPAVRLHLPGKLDALAVLPIASAERGPCGAGPQCRHARRRDRDGRDGAEQCDRDRRGHLITVIDRSLGGVGRRPTSSPGAGDAATISSRPLGLIQRVVCPLDQRGDAELRGPGRGDADAHRDRDGLAARDHREGRHLPPHRLGGLLRPDQRRVGKNDQELVAAVPAPHVRAPQHARELRADGAEQIVAAQVPQFVVDRLEMVDVEHQDRQRLSGTARSVAVPDPAFRGRGRG